MTKCHHTTHTIKTSGRCGNNQWVRILFLAESTIFLQMRKTFEEFYLRYLLTHRPGMASFEEIRTHKGILHDSYIETAAAMGLLQSEKEWIHCMEDFASVITNTQKLRELFVTILCHNNPHNVKTLWDRFKEELSDDFKYKQKN